MNKIFYIKQISNSSTVYIFYITEYLIHCCVYKLVSWSIAMIVFCWCQCLQYQNLLYSKPLNYSTELDQMAELIVQPVRGSLSVEVLTRAVHITAATHRLVFLHAQV